MTNNLIFVAECGEGFPGGQKKERPLSRNSFSSDPSASSLTSDFCRIHHSRSQLPQALRDRKNSGMKLDHREAAFRSGIKKASLRLRGGGCNDKFLGFEPANELPLCTSRGTLNSASMQMRASEYLNNRRFVELRQRNERRRKDLLYEGRGCFSGENKAN